MSLFSELKRRKVFRVAIGYVVAAWLIAQVAAYFGDSQFALKVKGQEMRTSTVRMATLWYPILSEARQSDEFKKLVTDLNLVEYWRAYGWADACTPLGDDDFTCI